MVKETKSQQNLEKRKKRIPLFHIPIYLFLALLIIAVISAIGGIIYFEKTYEQKIYPGVRIDGLSFGGKSREFVKDYFEKKSAPFANLVITLQFEDKIATLAGKLLESGYDSNLSAVQAYSVGRSGYLLSDIYQKWKAGTVGINLTSVFKMNSDLIEDTLNTLSLGIDTPEQNALFQFENGKVILFKTSKEGRKLNREETHKLILTYIMEIPNLNTFSPEGIIITLPVDAVYPSVSTENSNNFGIKELLASGNSKFVGSIPGRIHNIELAASRINGQLIAPGAIFSFNDALGDVSSGTGFQPAYIIKDGRTVLGDGGGVCQVSTTLFRAALNAGLPIEERHAHSYRVSYYEQDSSPGLDATVFAPGYDLKFKNDTQNYILIQAKTDRNNYSLTFELYGTSDGRKSEVTKPVILSQSPPPPDLYQDDATIPKGVVKQVDWKAAGAKVNFDYKVTRNGEVLIQQSFFSNFQPWQAVYLRGTRE